MKIDPDLKKQSLCYEKKGKCWNILNEVKHRSNLCLYSMHIQKPKPRKKKTITSNLPLQTQLEEPCRHCLTNHPATSGMPH